MWGLTTLAASSSAFGSVHSALHSTAFEIARNSVVFLAIVFWLGLAYRVFRDARRRIDDPWLVATATLLALVAPYIGAVIYLLFRPPETLADVRAREVELRALEERLIQRLPRCAVCRAEVEPSFLVCPVCTTRLKEPCGGCSAPLDPLWQACPYCETPVGAKVSQSEPAGPDLDAALTAEVAATGKGKPAGRRARANAPLVRRPEPAGVEEAGERLRRALKSCAAEPVIRATSEPPSTSPTASTAEPRCPWRRELRRRESSP